MVCAGTALNAAFFETTAFFDGLPDAAFFVDPLVPDAPDALAAGKTAFFAGDSFAPDLAGGAFFAVFLVATVLPAGFLMLDLLDAPLFEGAFLTVFFPTDPRDADTLEGDAFLDFVADDDADFFDTRLTGALDGDSLGAEALDAAFFDGPDALALRGADFFFAGLEAVFFATPERSSQTHRDQTTGKQTLLACRT